MTLRPAILLVPATGSIMASVDIGDAFISFFVFNWEEIPKDIIKKAITHPYPVIVAVEPSDQFCHYKGLTVETTTDKVLQS